MKEVDFFPISIFFFYQYMQSFKSNVGFPERSSMHLYIGFDRDFYKEGSVKLNNFKMSFRLNAEVP